MQKTALNFGAKVMITIITMTSCISNKNTMKMDKIFPKGQKATEYFTGDAWIEMLTTDAANFDAMSYIVTFAPGSRNYWHSHPGGQILYCTSGEGYYQEKGKSIQSLKAGDVVEIKPNVVHWHGATPDKEFVHIGVSTQLSKGAATWYGAVTDEEYNRFGR
jgi:quercetin dioxygenase-like cupin family protein